MAYSVIRRDGKWPPVSAWVPLGPRTSTPMKHALRKLLREEAKAIVSRSTIQALRARGLVDRRGALTETGTAYAVSLCPLHEQAARLGIPFRQESIARSGSRPEIDLLRRYRAKGADGCFTEGGIVSVLLYCIWLDTLLDCAEYAMREWRAGRRHARVVESMYYNRYNVFGYFDFAAAFPAVRRALIRAINHSDKQQVIRSYRKIESWRADDTWFPYGYYGITEKLVVALFEILGPNRLRRIAMLFLEDPYLYSKGWPDLLVIKDGVPRFIEVKTTDRLHVSQIIVMPDMMAAGDLEFEILRITKAKRRRG